MTRTLLRLAAIALLASTSTGCASLMPDITISWDRGGHHDAPRYQAPGPHRGMPPYAGYPYGPPTPGYQGAPPPAGPANYGPSQPGAATPAGHPSAPPAPGGYAPSPYGTAGYVTH